MRRRAGVVTGGDATICETQNTYQLLSTITNTSTILWTSTGSGSFDNNTNEDPVYTLSPTDKTLTSINFTVTVSEPGCLDVSDSMTLTIQKNPTADAGLDQIICQGDQVTLNGIGTN